MEPNPRVGAVVVHNGRIIGEGAHERYGGPHAEVNAIAAVKDPSLLRESTLYVSLEPCNHHGKTPPCVGLILEKGIPRVVVGALDPNPQMQGKSVAFLRSQGVEVTICQDPSLFADLNPHFEVNQRLGRPYVVLKWAESADGLISGQNAQGEPEPRAISSPAVNRRLHGLRHELQAILIGKRTAQIDEPSLTTRLWPGRNPVRIVLDTQAALPARGALFSGERTIVINQVREEIVGNVHYWKVKDTRDLQALLEGLYRDQKIGSILVEGGQMLAQQFLNAGIWDEIYRAISPNALGNGTAAPRIPSPHSPRARQIIGTDTVEWYANASLVK